MSATELYQRYIKAQRDRDITALMTCWHSDAVGIHPMRPDRGWEGVEANERIWLRMWQDNPNGTYEVVAVAITDERIFLETRISLPDGTIVPGVTILEVSGDKFSECRVYADIPVRDGVGIEVFSFDEHSVS
jgi:SnoaL-like domain